MNYNRKDTVTALHEVLSSWIEYFKNNPNYVPEKIQNIISEHNQYLKMEVENKVKESIDVY